jgi:hypothetical protein
MNVWGPDTTHSFGVVTRKWKYLYWYSQENGMLATEELFDMQGDRSELTNASADEENLSELNRMRELYDQHVYEIKDKAINPSYRKFNTLFDRKQTWETKERLLSNSRGKAKSQN